MRQTWNDCLKRTWVRIHRKFWNEFDEIFYSKDGLNSRLFVAASSTSIAVLVLINFSLHTKTSKLFRILLFETKESWEVPDCSTSYGQPINILWIQNLVLYLRFKLRLHKNKNHREILFLENSIKNSALDSKVKKCD